MGSETTSNVHYTIRPEGEVPWWWLPRRPLPRGLVPINSPPTLHRGGLFGLKMWGEEDVAKDSGLYTATHTLFVLGLPLLPLARYRVVDVGPHHQCFFKKLPLKAAQWFWIITLLGVVLVGSTLLLAKAPQPGARLIPHTQQSGASGQGYSPPIAPSAPSYSAESPRANDRTYPVVPPEPKVDVTRASRLALKEVIQDRKRQLASMEAQLSALESETQKLKRSLSSSKADIEATERNMELGVYVDRFAYESAVDDYNVGVGRYNTLMAQYKQRYAEYAAFLDDTNALGREYNSRLR